MKTKLLLSLLLSFYFYLLSSQVPQGFNYQAIARDGSGNPIISTPLQVRLTLQADSAGTNIIWQELHGTVTTNNFGLFTLILGRGTRQAGSALTFDAVDWSITPKFIRTEVNYGGWKDMGTTRLWSVPYSLYAKIAGNVFSGNYNDLSNRPVLFDGTWSSLSGKPAFASVATSGSYNDLLNKPTILNSQWTTNGTSIYYNSGNVGIGTATPGFKLDIVGRSRIQSGGGDAGIWYMDNTNTLNRSFIGMMGNDNVGLYGAGGIGWGFVMNVNNGNVGIGSTAPSSKVVIQPPSTWDDNTPLFEVKNKSGVTVFAVYNNGVRAFVQTNSGKGVKGGFAIGGFDPSKAGNVDLMTITPDSIRFYIDNGTAKATKGGFAIGSFNTSKGANQDFMYVTPQATANGLYNTFIGYQTGHSILATGNYNAFMGYNAGYSNTDGDDNVFIGYRAGLTNSTGYDNVFVGMEAGLRVTTGYENVIIGKQAGVFTTTGFRNTFLGEESGYYNTTGSGNTFLGLKSGMGNTTGAYNVYIGELSGNRNQGGTYNTFIGYYCSRGSATNNGNLNTSLGAYAGYSCTGYSNLNLGYQAGYSTTTGHNNTMVGVGAGYGNITGSGNVFLGSGAGGNEANSDKLYIDNSNTVSPLIWGDFSTNKLVVNGSSTDNPLAFTLYVNGTAGGDYGWNVASDLRFKKNIETIGDPLSKVKSLRGVYFNWNDTSKTERQQMGFIAQEAEGTIPQVVSKSNGYYSMDYAPITALLIEGMKQQQKLIETQNEKIDHLEKIVEEMQAALNRAGVK